MSPEGTSGWQKFLTPAERKKVNLILVEMTGVRARLSELSSELQLMRVRASARRRRDSTKASEPDGTGGGGQNDDAETDSPEVPDREP